MKTIISIIDELYNTQHIPCAIFDDQYHLIHPRITIINFKEFLNDIFTMTHHHVHILVYENCVAYARLEITYKNKDYFIIIGCILNTIEKRLPTSWTNIISEHFIRSHVACIHLVTFQNFVKMVYEIVTHKSISTHDIHIDHINQNNNHRKDDTLTNRRINQSTPNYYHWEQMLFDKYRQGDLSKVKSLLSQLDVFESLPLTKNILQDQIFKFIGFITILTRINIQEGVSSELAFSLSDQIIHKIDQVKQYQDLTLLFQQAIHDFYYQLSEAKKSYYSLHIYKCIHYIDTHLYEKVSLHHLSQHTGLSLSYLSIAFKQEMNETVTSYIQRKKVEEAARLLLFTNKSHSEISCLLNFSSQSNFIQIFKKHKLITPKQYQESHLKDY